MKQNWKSLIVMAGLLMLLSGCITQQTETSITNDGSGKNVMKTGLSTQAAEMIKSSGGNEPAEDPFEKARQQVEGLPAEWNAKVEDWKDADFEGIQVTMDFKDMTMLNAQLTQMLEESDANAESPTGTMFKNIAAKEENGKFLITADVDTQSAGSDDPQAAAMFADAVISWKITMPGAIEEYGAQEIATKDGNTVTWKFPLDKPGAYKLSIQGAKSSGVLGSVGGGGSSLPLILGGVGGLVVLGGLGYMLMNRRKPAVAVDAGSYAGGSQPPYNPNATYGQQGGYQSPQGGYGPPPSDPNAGYGPPQGGYSPPPSDPNAGYGPPQGGYQQPNDPNDPTRR